MDYTACDNGLPQLCSSGKIYFTVNGITGTGIIASETLCNNDSTGTVSTTPTGNAPFTFLWNTGAITQNISSVPAGLYSVIITDSLGCSINDSATVQQPLVLSTGTTIADVNCFDDSTGSVLLNVSGGTSPYSFLWSNGATSQNLLLVPANIYSALITDANGCTKNISATVSQPSSPITTNASITPSDCLDNLNGAIDLTVSGGSPGYSYSWSDGQITSDINEIAGTYTITVTDANGCTISTAYTISDVSNLLIISSNSNTFCEGDSTTLSTSVIGGVLQWYLNGNIIPGATNSIYVTKQTGTYSLSLTNICGAFTSNNLGIVVKPIPVLDINGALNICEGSSTQLIVNGATQYTWSPATGLNNNSIGNPVASPNWTTVYTVYGSTSGCSKDSVITITVNPLPVVSVSSTQYDCERGTQITATGGNTYAWSPVTGLDSNMIATPIAIIESSTTYFVTVTSSAGCTTTNSVNILVDCDTIIIPEGFSPDGDGTNDLLVFEGIEKFPGNSLSIFNRWGNIVYTKDDYDNTWDAVAMRRGIIMGEGKVPAGTYFYVLKLGEIDKARAGYLIIKY